MARMLYFAYGSNMSREQMARRCPNAKLLGIGRLLGYQLVFNRKGTYRAGAVASIEPSSDPDAIVYGAIWRIDANELAKLDQFENPKAYERKELAIERENGDVAHCHVYVAFPVENYPDPDPEYLELIIRSATDLGLPVDYVLKLKDFRS